MRMSTSESSEATSPAVLTFSVNITIGMVSFSTLFLVTNEDLRKAGIENPRRLHRHGSYDGAEVGLTLQS